MNSTKSKTKKIKSSKPILNTKSDSSSSLDESAGSDGPLHNERIKDIKIIEPKVDTKSPKPGDKNKMKEAELRKSIKDKLHTGSKEYVQTKHLSDTRPVRDGESVPETPPNELHDESSSTESKRRSHTSSRKSNANMDDAARNPFSIQVTVDGLAVMLFVL